MKDKPLTTRAVRLNWRLPALMSERGIYSNAELRRRLLNLGIGISSAQMSRIVGERPRLLRLDMLEGLMTVLACGADELLEPGADRRDEQYAHSSMASGSNIP